MDRLHRDFLQLCRRYRIRECSIRQRSRYLLVERRRTPVRALLQAAQYLFRRQPRRDVLDGQGKRRRRLFRARRQIRWASFHGSERDPKRRSQSAAHPRNGVQPYDVDGAAGRSRLDLSPGCDAESVRAQARSRAEAALWRRSFDASRIYQGEGALPHRRAAAYSLHDGTAAQRYHALIRRGRLHSQQPAHLQAGGRRSLRSRWPQARVSQVGRSDGAPQPGQTALPVVTVAIRVAARRAIALRLRACEKLAPQARNLLLRPLALLGRSRVARIELCPARARLCLAGTTRSADSCARTRVSNRRGAAYRQQGDLVGKWS